MHIALYRLYVVNISSQPWRSTPYGVHTYVHYT